MNMSEQDQQRLFHVLTLNNTYYVSFRTVPVQRWNAIALGPGRDYHCLNMSIWRKAGLTGAPEGSRPAAGGRTIYFNDMLHARDAAIAFLDALKAKGVKV